MEKRENRVTKEAETKSPLQDLFLNDIFLVETGICI